MTYADITFKDKNAIKRWLQSRRLVVASRIADAGGGIPTVFSILVLEMASYANSLHCNFATNQLLP